MSWKLDSIPDIALKYYILNNNIFPYFFIRYKIINVNPHK